MKAKKRFLSLLLCGAMLFSLCPQATFAEGVEAGGLCEHHPQHTAECGYTEGSEGTPCSHEHTEDCYILATQCVHEHGPECYPQESVEPAETEGATDDAATPSGPEEQEPTERAVWAATRLAGQHYTPATEGTPCTYVCEICNPQDSGESEETEPVGECVCTELCTSENVNVECPVCGVEGADLTACEGEETEMATLSNALAAEPNADTGVFTVTGGTGQPVNLKIILNWDDQNNQYHTRPESDNLEYDWQVDFLIRYRDIKDSITASSPWYSYEENDKPLIVHLYGNNSSDSETITVDNLPYEEDHGTDHLKS